MFVPVQVVILLHHLAQRDGAHLVAFDGDHRVPVHPSLSDDGFGESHRIEAAMPYGAGSEAAIDDRSGLRVAACLPHGYVPSGEVVPSFFGHMIDGPDTAWI